VPTAATLVGGPITDLNVMTRRGRISHKVERLSLSGGIEVEPAGETTLILTIGGAKINAGDAARLGPLDTLILDRGSLKARLEPEGQGPVFLISFHSAGIDR
jgi:environmental stress-induced protein Ves